MKLLLRWKFDALVKVYSWLRKRAHIQDLVVGQA